MTEDKKQFGEKTFSERLKDADKKLAERGENKKEISGHSKWVISISSNKELMKKIAEEREGIR